jgi:hypothetical protein
MARRLFGMLVMGMMAGCGVASGASLPLLSPSDFAEPGWRISSDQPSSAWAFAMPQCPAYDAASYPAQQHRSAVRARGFVHPQHRASERVETFDSGWAARSLEDTRRVVEACTRYEYGSYAAGEPGFRESHAIVDSGFAGDESILVKTNRVNVPGESYTRYTAVVRKGDRVVTLAAIGLSPEAVLELALRAAR